VLEHGRVLGAVGAVAELAAMSTALTVATALIRWSLAVALSA